MIGGLEVSKLDIEALDLSFKNDHGLFTQTQFLGLQGFDAVVVGQNGLGKGVFLGMAHVTASCSDVFLDGVVALCDGVAALQDLGVFALDLFEEMGDFRRQVGNYR